jgi:hypothetical protein
MNPGMRTIQAKRPGTCPISDEAIEVGDSITKTPAGWALTEHVQSFMENPLQIKRGKGKFKQTPQSVREQDRYTAAAEMAYFEGGPGERYLTSSAPVRKYQQVENPSKGGDAMRYARAHGVSLKEGWAAVKAGLSNPYYENPSMGGAAMKYARAHGVSLKQGWAAVKSGKANPAGFAVGDVVESLSKSSAGLRGVVIGVRAAPNIPLHLLDEEGRALLAMGGPVMVEYPNAIVEVHPADIRKVAKANRGRRS